MAVRATRPSAYNEALQLLSSLRTMAEHLDDDSLAGPVGWHRIQQFFEHLIGVKLRLNTISQIPGMANYVRSQEGDANYDAVTEFGAAITQINTCINRIIADVPAAGGYIQVYQISVNGITERQFSTAVLTNLRAQLNLLIDTIN